MTKEPKMRNGLTRRLILATLVVVVLAGASLYAWNMFNQPRNGVPEPSYWPTVSWRTTTPEAVGIDSTKLALGMQAIKDNGISIHSLLIIGEGEVLLNGHFYPYDGTTYHDMASCTKSVMTTLIGIAVDHGKLSLDDKVLSFFPDRTVANRDTRKEMVTVRHLASMSSGFSCIALPREVTLDEMQASVDWVQFALDRPMATDPGKRFLYDSLGMHLLSAILEEATGMTSLEFARQNLFGPLGISKVYWPSDPQGHTRGWGDLSLYPADSAKIGFLFLHGGRWDGRQIVSSSWVTAATSRQIHPGGDYGEDYGYGWWISAVGDEPAYFQAEGRQTQRILVVPSMNLVLVETGAGFNTDDVNSYIEASIVDLQKPLQANPAGVAELEAVLAKCAEKPAAQAVPPLPSTAFGVSGKTFVFDDGVIRSVRLDFDGSSAATYYLDVRHEDEIRVGGAGLDGVWRPSLSAKPAIARGSWTDDQTFTLEYYEGPGLNYYKFVLRFDGDLVTLSAAGLGTMEGRLP